MTAPEIIRSDGTRLQGRTVSARSQWVLSLEPCDLTWIVIDHQVRLRFDDVVVTIENDFVLRRNGADFPLSPGDREGLGPLLALYPDTLAAGRVARTLAIDTDGVMSIGEWGRNMSLGPTVAAARQNLALIVDNGQPAPDLDENPHDKWGATVRKPAMTATTTRPSHSVTTRNASRPKR